MKWWIKFLKEYEDADSKKHLKDSVFEVDEEVGKSLIALKIAEKTEAPKEGDVKELFDKVAESFKDLAAQTVKTALAEIEVGVRKRIPAVPIDERERKMQGFKNETEYFKAVMQACAPGGHVDKRLIIEKGDPSGHNTGVESEGGILVPETISDEMMEIMLGDDSFESQTDQRTTTSNNLNLKGFLQTGHSLHQRNAGFVTYWADEADQYTASMLKFQTLRLELRKIIGAAYVTDEEMSDSSFAWGSELSKRAADSFKFQINGAMIDGTGAGMPEGIMYAPATKTCPIVNAQENNILHANIRKMWALMHPELRSGAVWLVHPDMEEILETISFMDDTSSRVPVYLPAGGISGKGYATLKGRPVIATQHCHSLGEYGDIILVNWRPYITLRKAGEGVKRSSSIHVRFMYDEMVFKFSTRVDGQSGWRHPIQDKHGTATRGHAVILAARQASGETSSGL